MQSCDDITKSLLALINNAILPALHHNLCEMGHTIPTEDLTTALTTIGNSDKGAPATTIPGKTVTKPKSTIVSRKRKQPEVVTEGEPPSRCKWVYKRGGKVGERCGKFALPGEDYCKICKTPKTKKQKKVLESNNDNAPESEIKGTNGDTSDNSGVLTAKEFDIERGLHIIVAYNYIVTKTPDPDNDLVAIGLYNKETEMVEDLTDEQKEHAKSIGLLVHSNKLPVISSPTNDNLDTSVENHHLLDTIPSIPKLKRK